MAEATSEELYQRQHGLKARLAELEAEEQQLGAARGHDPARGPAGRGRAAMSGPKKAAPEGYAEIEQAIAWLDHGVDDVWVAGKLGALDIAPARTARRLLLAGLRDEALALLEHALCKMAGPEHARDLGWFTPTAPEPTCPKPMS